MDVPKFYCPVTTLLLAPGEKNAWHGVRTTGEIKRDKQVKNVANPDSLYTVSSTLYYFICFKYIIDETVYDRYSIFLEHIKNICFFVLGN